MTLLKRRKRALPLVNNSLLVKTGSGFTPTGHSDLTVDQGQTVEADIAYPTLATALDGSESGTIKPGPTSPTETGQFFAPGSDAGRLTPPTQAEQLSRLLSRALEEIYAPNGNKTRARAYFRQVLALDPFNESALLWLGYLTEDVDRRLALFEYAVSLYPQNAVAQAYLKEALARRDEVNELVAHAAKEEFWERSRRAQARRQQYIPHLGEYLVSRKLLTQAQLEEALAYHHELIVTGSKKKLGEILLERNYLAPEQLEHILKLQEAEFNSHFKN